MTMPAKLNQFYRILDGKRGADYTSGFEAANCWATAEGEAIAFATEGKVTWTPPQVRAHAGPAAQKRRAGWIDPDIYTAAANAGLVNLGAHPDDRSAGYYQPSGMAWKTLVRLLGDPKLAFVVATDYGDFPDDLAVVDSFDGNHSIVLFGGTVHQIKGGNYDGQAGITGDDPLALNRKAYPLSVIQKAAQHVGRSSELPKGWVYATRFRVALPEVTPPPPPPDPKDAQIAALQAQVAQLTDQLSAEQLSADGLQDRLDQIEAIASGSSAP